MEQEQYQQILVSPRGAQIEALYELKKAREEGVNKGLVVAATGVGKTYLAAFDSVNFKRILFVAHREEILKQAEASFKTVRPASSIGYFSGGKKDEGANIYLATVQTLSKETNYTNFSPDFFDYVIVDEFHYAAADSYLSILNYFEPKFLLGLTATPYRTDNRDIFSLCEDNVIYEIYLKDAINRDLLVPFKYYGVFDPTDYSQIPHRNGNYVVSELERQLSHKERANLILSYYHKFAGKRTLGFCVSIEHAEYMAAYFTSNGIPAAAVHSGTKGSSLKRDEDLKALENLSIEVIFAVDIFNEGVDIPSLDTVMFLRPTESFVVFLQQLGRGLRKYQEKNYLTVLDFIGNYKKAHYIPALLAGENPLNPKLSKGKRSAEYDYPDNCLINFDFKVLDLFEEMAKQNPLKIRIRDDYFRLCNHLGRRPGRTDLYHGSDIPFREFIKDGWLRLLKEMDDLSPVEEGWLGTPAEEFLRDIEKTSMSKSYKIPTIGALLEKGDILPKVTLYRVGDVFQSFYKNHLQHQRDLHDKSNRDWQTWVLDKYMKLARKNPIHFLSRGKFFNYDEINKVFYLSEELHPHLSPLLAQHVEDILEFKRLNYFRRRFKVENEPE